MSATPVLEWCGFGRSSCAPRTCLLAYRLAASRIHGAPSTCAALGTSAVVTKVDRLASLM